MTSTSRIIARANALTARREAHEAVRKAQAAKCTQAVHRAIQRLARATFQVMQMEIRE